MDISQIRPETCSFILDQLPGLLYCVEDCRNGQFVKISENCKELFGYTQQEIKSEKEVGLKCLVHKDDYILMKKKLNTKRVSGKNKVFEFRIQTKDGKVKWLRDIETEIVNPNEGPNLIYGILHDITHFKNSGELNRAFAAFQNAVNGGSIVSITDKSGKIIFANELFCKVSKYTQRELIGRKHSILKSGIHDFAFFSDMWETISEGKTWRGEIKNKAKDGSFYWVDTVISPIFDAYGAVEKYLSIRNVITERKIQEQELLEAHQFSQEILNSVAISIAVINKEGKIVSVNKHWDQFAKENSINGKVKTFLGENYFEVCKRSFDAGDDIAGMILTGLQSLAQGLISEYKFDYPCHSENKNRWFTLSANRFGSGEYLVISHHDITSNKEIRDRLIKSEGRLRTILDTEPECIKILDQEGRILEMNKAGLMMVEAVCPDQVKGLKVSDLILPEFKQDFESLYRGSLKGLSGTLEFEIETLKGNIKTFETHMVPFSSEDMEIQSLSVTRDITQKKKTEQELLLLSKRYHQVIENIHDCIVIDDLTGKIIFANRQFFKTFQLDPQNQDKIGIEDYVATESIEEVINRHFDRIAGNSEAEETFEFLGTNQAGDKFWLEAKVTCIIENQKIIGTQAILRNIHQRKMDELELAKRNKELIQFNSELDKFVYSTSHDLRAPIISVKSLLSICMDEFYQDNHELQGLFARMMDGLNRSDQIIQKILDFSRSKNLLVQKESIPLRQFFLNLIEERIISTEQEVMVEINPELRLSSDPDRLVIVVENILDNALIFHPKNQEIKLVKITACVEGNGVRINISDNGEGIHEDYHHKIFDMFFRASSISKGAGLGLYLTKQTLETLGGNISVQSQLKQGSTFSVFLPNL